jgi:hypothetical protein
MKKRKIVLTAGDIKAGYSLQVCTSSLKMRLNKSTV